MRVLGIVGLIGSGKDTASDYIAEKYGFTIVSYRDIVKEVTEKEGLEPNRENMQNISRQYRDRYGESIFAELVLEKAKKIEGKILLKEMRTTGDIDIPKEFFGGEFIVIDITARIEIRFERMSRRNRLGDPKNLQEFMKQEDKEEKFGYKEGIKMADYTIENNGTMKELYEKIDNMMEEIYQ